MKKHQISLDFSKLRVGSGSGGAYLNMSPSTINIARSSVSQGGGGLTGKSIRFSTPLERMGQGYPSTTVTSKMKQGAAGLGRNTAPVTVMNTNHNMTDKTVCQYCGVSYLTIAEMRSLQTTVKEQSDQLSKYSETLSENSNLKEVIGNLRRTHHEELMKYEEEVQWMKGRSKALDDQIESLQGSNEQDAMGDRRGGTNSLINEKMKVLESAIRNIILNPQFKDKPETESLISKFEEINQLKNQKLNEHEHFNQLKGAMDTLPPQRKTKLRVGNGNESRKVASLNAIEVHDLRRENITLVEKVRNLMADLTSSQEMHACLRETLDKLKIDNENLHEEMNGFRVQYQESLVKHENLDAQLKGLRAENERLRSVGKEQELRLRTLEEQNRILKNSVDQKLVDRLQMSLAGLKKQIQEHQVQTDKVRFEFQQKLGEARRETGMEKERADSCLASSLLEREEQERRWDERWARHQQSLMEQLDSLRNSYEKTLSANKVHEESLQKEVGNLREKYEKSKEAWEAYRKSLNDQVAQWKVKYEQKQVDLETARQSKVEVELLYQEKSAEMESLHEIIREGCEERQELQKQILEMKDGFEEARRQGQRPCFPERPLRPSPPIKTSLLTDATNQGGYCSFAQLKEKCKTNHENLELVTSGFLAPPPTSECYNPPLTAPILSKVPASQSNNQSRNQQKKTTRVSDLHLFTIGKGIKQTQPSTPTSKSNAINNTIVIAKNRTPSLTKQKK